MSVRCVTDLRQMVGSLSGMEWERTWGGSDRRIDLLYVEAHAETVQDLEMEVSRGLDFGQFIGPCLLTLVQTSFTNSEFTNL